MQYRKYGTGIRNALMKKEFLVSKGEIVNKPSKQGNSFFQPKSNSYASINSSDISYNKFPSSTPSCPQDLGHDLSIISEEIEALDKITNQNLQCITRDHPKECVNIETQTGDVSFAEYVDSEVGPMTIYLLRWQIKVQRLIATAINLQAHSAKLSLC